MTLWMLIDSGKVLGKEGYSHGMTSLLILGMTT